MGSAEGQGEFGEARRLVRGCDLVWDDPLHVILPDRIAEGELRWHAVGVAGGVVILVVVHAYPGGDEDDRIRIIGARKATPHERRRYEQEGA